MIVGELPEGVPPGPDAPMRLVPEDVEWADVPELGESGFIFDQDMVALERMRVGLRSDAIDHITLANYQEQNIRGLHEDVDELLGVPVSRPLTGEE